MLQLKRARNWHSWGLLAALLLTLPAALPLLPEGLVNTRAGGDSPFLLVRVHQLATGLEGGVFPVRWMPDAAYGLGYPFFNYYAPLAFYLAAAMHWLGAGYIWAIKLTQALGFGLAAAGMYLLARRHVGKAGAVLASLGYTYAPFHLANVYVRGDSLAEFYAFAFYPFILLALDRLSERPTAGNSLFVAGSYAGLVLTHNISALIFTPFAAIYALMVLFKSRDANDSSPGVCLSIRHLQVIALGFLLGLALSVWYWGPALGEQHYARLEKNLSGYFHYAGHFRGTDLVKWFPAFDYKLGENRTPFALSSTQVILSLAGGTSLAWIWIRDRRQSLEGAFFAAALVLSVFMITPLSRPLWDRMPLLPFVQFPWRFLSVAGFFGSLLAGYLLTALSTAGKRWGLTALLGLFLIATSLLHLPAEHLPITSADVTAERLRLYELFTTNIGSTVRAEYLPQAVAPRPYTSVILIQDKEKPMPRAVEGELAASRLVSQRAGEESWQVTITSSKARLIFYAHWFPGWRATVDGQRVATQPASGSGYISLSVPQGQHNVALRFDRTEIRMISEAISAAAAIVVLALFLRQVVKSRAAADSDRLQLILAIMLSTTACFVLVRSEGSDFRNLGDFGSLDGSETKTVRLSALTMDFNRMPYLHPNPDGVRYGKTRLVGYQLAKDRLRPGHDLPVTLHWESPGGRAPSWRAELSVVSPAAHLFDVPATFASETERLTAETEYNLSLPRSVPPGLHFLRLRVFDAAGEEIVPTGTPEGNTASLGTTYLRPVRVLPAASSPPFTPEFSMGEGIVLGSARTEPHGDDWLRVELTWQTNRRLAANYATSVRLLGPEGERTAATDAQPCYGFCPTTSWQTGRPVHDRRWLALPADFTPAPGHRLELILYEHPSLQALGTATFDLDSDLSVMETERNFEIPEMDRQLNVDFGDQIRLLGYDLSRREAQLDLTLHWRALRHIDDDYKVFAHLFEPATEEIVAQHDARPLGGAHPTQRWVDGEIISDPAHLPLDDVPAGVYRLAVGLYTPASMKRLTAIQPDGTPLLNGRVILSETIELP